MSATIPLIILTGPVGVGKTSVGEAMSELLASHQLPHAFIDRDALCRSWPPQGRFNEDVAYKNLESVWRNFRAVGAECLIVAGVVETRAGLEKVRAAVPDAEPVVCCLRASLETREARLRARDEGESLKRHLARTVKLEQIVEQAGLEDFSFANDEKPVQAVAREILLTTGWLSDAASAGDGE